MIIIYRFGGIMPLFLIFIIYYDNYNYVGFPQVMTVFKTLFPLSLENYENARRVLNKVRSLES
jgi:hypothetical protein